jgi:hypothetical protein
MLIKKYNQIEVDKALQKQVDDYFPEDNEHPEDGSEEN